VNRPANGAPAALGIVPAQDDVIAKLARHRVLPLAVLDADNAQSVGAALVQSGLPILEVTLRNRSALEAIRAARRVSGLCVGAGTVLSVDQAAAAFEAGAQFALAPGLNEEVVAHCRQLGLPFFPGIATATELDRACRLGLRVLKVFPIDSLGGPKFLRALSAVYPDVRFIPTGGIIATALTDYLDLPSVLACGGSWVIDAQALRARRFDVVANRAHDAAQLAR
jgi:2-dehydro-3-deoxyphosphogluconate aldolase / (4S)-4-hydroxy-2-oxoglutarate aldolase